MTRYILAIIAVTSFFAHLALFDESLLANDAAQYMSVARNFLNDKTFATSHIYYEAQHQFGYIPAPQTVFPNGYPFFIAVMAATGLPVHTAAFVLALSSFIITGVLIFRIMKLAGHHDATSLVASAVWYGFSVAWENFFTCYSEMVFVLATVLSLYFFAAAGDRHRRLFFFAAGIFAGLAFSIRYVGVFYFGSLILYFAVVFLDKKSKQALADLFWVSLAPVGIFLATIGRNFYLTGTIRGSFPHYSLIPSGLLNRLGGSIRNIFGLQKRTGQLEIGLSDGLVSMADYSLRVLLLFFILLIAVKAIEFVCRGYFPGRFRQSKTLRLAGLYILVSTAGLIYFDLTGSEPILYRYLIPMVPFILLAYPDLKAIVEENGSLGRRIFPWLTAGLLAVFAIGQINYFLYYYDGNFVSHNAKYKRIYTRIDTALKTMKADPDLSEIFSTQITSTSPILSNQSHIFHAILKKPVLGLSRGEYTKRIWDFEETRRLVNRFNVRYIVYFHKTTDFDDPALANQSLFERIDAGDHPPWTRIIYDSPEVTLLRVDVSGVET